MTARHQIRVGNRRLGRERAAIDATPAPTTGEMLQAAREKKGVDLYRAERDTKIRAKYLAALENSDPAELPSPVYTKGFLRNYALYLGLDPDEVLTRWKSETVVPRQARPVVAPPPRPLEAPRRGLIITPGLFVGLLLIAAILAFAGYLGVQLFRFSQPPLLAITAPPNNLLQLPTDRSTYTLAGTANPGATVTITAAGDQQHQVTADAAGRWSREVSLTKGRNDFTIVATDADTKKDSPATSVIITVPLPIATTAPGASLAPGETLAPGATPPPLLPPAQLALTAPTEGASLAQGSVTVSGTTDGTTVTVTAQQPAAAGGSPAPSSAPSPGAAPSAPTGPVVSPAPGSGPAPLTLTPVAGTFSGMMALPAGKWRLDITSSGTGLSPRTESRTVSVAYSGVTVLVEARRGAAWLKVWVDGRVAEGYTVGVILKKGTSATFTAARNIVVRTGNAGGTAFTVNGVDKGILGRPGGVETWLFQVGREPLRTAGQ